MKTLKTENPAFGFYGTVQTAGWNPDAAWNIASRRIAEIFDKDIHEIDLAVAIRDFLDSRLGRHFADEAISITRSGRKVKDTGLERLSRIEAIDLAIATHMEWTISAATEREEGIPRDLPFLIGWIQHFAIASESAAQ